LYEIEWKNNEFLFTNITGRPNNVVNFIKNNSISILNRFNNKFPSLNSIEKLINSWLNTTKKSIDQRIWIYLLQMLTKEMLLLL